MQSLGIQLITALPTRSDVDITSIRGKLAKGYKIIDNADNLFQFYNLDTPGEIANAGMDSVNNFTSRNFDESVAQRLIEVARLRYLGCHW